MKFILTIHQDVPLTIFDNNLVKEKAKKIFEKLDLPLRAKYKEIINFLGEDSNNIKELSYDNILYLTTKYMYNELANKAVELCFKEQKFNVLENILSLLDDEETLKTHILKEHIVYAFQKGLANMPKEDYLDRIKSGSRSISLSEHFLNQPLNLL